ncbi:MAG: DUF3108 domain-containing protein [candidate division Zixibacteria bacterium]|nr:DUF3108 domain-containing protein [candidate division Zixibacteria bacterium]
MERTRDLKKLFLILLFLFLMHMEGYCFDYSQDEHSKYSVRFLGFPVVRVNIQNGPIDSDSGAYRISIEARTTKFWSMFYRVDNFYWTYLDTVGMPVVYKRKIEEKSIKKETEQTFDHRFNRIYYEGNTAIDHPGELENFFSGLFRLRTLPLEVGFRDSFYINAEKAIWMVRSNVLDTVELNHQGRDIECFKVDVEFQRVTPEAKPLPSDVLTLNIVSEDTDLKIYISSDERRLPIKIDYNLSPFNVVASIDEFPDNFQESQNSN